MEDMNLVENVEQAVESVVENIEPETVKAVGVTAAEVTGIAAFTCVVFECTKWAFKKLIKAKKERKAKKEEEKAIEDFDINKPIEPIDMGETNE